ncbi:hypothetical protein U8C40_10915 [Sinorhizobium medicae]|uniref:hypothetical protein n=1 Tax=Sinorhizobium medicae TaxID=110321 RepID=UPI002AF6BFC4|nr:hypothetical protein [Sinorhizobium medicae]WQO47104.1 hypothetical protein U8C42_09390 [Sinorhizobium medicae]WQO67570.1 hypothetical protein U8C40_10915 [Sinorhizobium medicae]WQO74467.1 hypothetical protein U8C31_09520 [Sinorhizobium medicae]
MVDIGQGIFDHYRIHLQQNIKSLYAQQIGVTTMHERISCMPNIDDIKVTYSYDWWGFTLTLNEDATQALQDVENWVVKIAAALPAELDWLGDVIAGYLYARQLIIQAEDKGAGVKLVSPWIAPTLLIPFPANAHIDDGQLRWSVCGFVDAEHTTLSWCDETKMTDVFSEDGPALAVHQDQLYCVARGGGSDSALWWMKYQTSWSTYTQIRDDVFSAYGPALASYNGLLYCLARGAGSDSQIWWMYYDGNGWSQYTPFPHVFTASGPALAVYNSRLFCVARGNEDDLWWMAYDGENWSQYTQIPNAMTGATPALCEYNGKLYCVHKGTGRDNNLWFLSYDDQNGWSQDNVISSSVYTADGPSLAVFDNRLFCAARGNENDQGLWWLYFDGLDWSQYRPIANAKSARRPAIVHYQQPKSSRDQLLMMHRGVES